MANAYSTSTQPGGDPYRRQVPTFQQEFDRELQAVIVKQGRSVPDMGDFARWHVPGNPGAESLRAVDAGGADGWCRDRAVSALTQIQEMTLVFVPKIIAVFITMLIVLPFMGATLSGHMSRVASHIVGG